MKKKLYIIKNTEKKRSAAFNMAADLFFKKKAEQENCIFLRFYKFSFPTITFGKFQKIENKAIEHYKKYNIDIARRMTGGRAVFHHLDSTYSFSSPLKFFSDPSLKGVYNSISIPFKNAFIKFDINAQIYSKKTKDYKSNFLCFGSVSLYEICCEGKKLLGSAQYRTERSVLQHGSMYGGISDLCPKGFEDMYQNIYVNKVVLKDDFTNNIIEEFIKHFDTHSEVYCLNKSDFQEISYLESKFSV